MLLILFNNLTVKDKSDAVKRLIAASTPRQDFFFMVVLSVATATFGLLLNNSAIIIGSMLIAPILYPIQSLSLGITISDNKLMARSFYTVLKSSSVGIVTAFIVTFLFSNTFGELTTEITSRTHATLPYFAVAITAGLAGSFALVKPQLNETLPGIAISVALIPPLAVVGIGLAKLDWFVISGSLLLFIINIIGVIFASMFTFSLMNFYVEKREAREVVEEEDKKVEVEKKMAEDKFKKRT